MAPLGRRRSTVLLAAFLALGVLGGRAEAQYVRRFPPTSAPAVITGGKITFTGNTLGLDKDTNANAPGIRGSIGTFITTNLASRDGLSWPFGTTADWRQNGSAAVLDLPATATVLYAELVWGGSWASNQEAVPVADLATSVLLITPASQQGTPIAPDSTTSRADGTASGGRCTSSGGCFYARTQNVTAQVQAGGAGRYEVRGVPGTQSTNENEFNVAGWTLAVVYEDLTQPIRNLTLFLGFERGTTATQAAAVSGFCTPPSGILAGRLAVSAIEGDALYTGDQIRFGPTQPLTPANQLSGPRNPPTNFFAGQITDDDGQLDTRGTFGDRNHTANSPVSGARQGWDIVNVDASPQLTHSQTQAFALGTTTSENYVITTLGLQIGVGAPRFGADTKRVDRPTARVGDVLTYTVDLVNTGTANADNVVFFDEVPPGTTFLPNSFRVGGVLLPGADPGPGVDLGTIAAGATVTVTFQAQVIAVPAAPDAAQYGNTARWTFGFISCANQPVTPGEIVTLPATTGIARIEATKAVAPTSLETGQPAIFTVTITNTGTARATGVTLTDPIPPGLTYVPGTTRLNTEPVLDGAGGTMPFATERPVNGLGLGAGQIDPGQSAVVSFQVAAAPNTQGTVTNTATIDPDGSEPTEGLE